MADNFEQKQSSLFVPKQERGHMRSAEEAEKARELVSEAKKIGSAEQKAGEWLETFTKFGGTRGRERIMRAKEQLAKEKKEIETAKAPAAEITPAAVLRETGVAPATEEGLRGAVVQAEQEQETREERLSPLAEVKKIGGKRLEKVIGGLSYLAAIDRLGLLGLVGGKRLAVEGGKDLAAIGLYPAAAVEEVGRAVAGGIQVEGAALRGILTEGKIKTLEAIPADQRREYHRQLLDNLAAASQRAAAEMVKGYEKMQKKGSILSLLEKLGGHLGKAAVERLEPRAL